MNKLTQNLLEKLFDYRCDNLYWKISIGNKKSGYLAGHVRQDGYRLIRIDGKLYLAHRLIFLYHHGYLPEFLDHIDGNKDNNDISNIREATKQENGMNQRKNKYYNGKLTSSKYKGVSWNKQSKKWHAQIRIDRKLKYLGRFTSEIEAALAYDRAAIEAFGKFAKLNMLSD